MHYEIQKWIEGREEWVTDLIVNSIVDVVDCMGERNTRVIKFGPQTELNQDGSYKLQETILLEEVQ